MWRRQAAAIIESCKWSSRSQWQILKFISLATTNCLSSQLFEKSSKATRMFGKIPSFSRCSGGRSISQARSLLSSYLKNRNTIYSALPHSLGAEAYISLHLPANFRAISLKAIALLSLSVGSLSGLLSLALSAFVSPVLSFIEKMCVVVFIFV